MTLFRNCVLFCAASIFCLAAPPAVHADTIAAGLNVQTDSGIAVGALVYTDVLGVQQWVYSNTETDVLDTRTTLFTATFADVLGIETLTVTDVCAQVTIVGPAVPCQQLAFAFEDLSLGDANLVSVFGDAGGQIVGDLAELAIGASVGSSGGTFNYDPPPPPVGATPEPESLALTATGLLSVAGIVRRRMRTSA